MSFSIGKLTTDIMYDRRPPEIPYPNDVSNRHRYQWEKILYTSLMVHPSWCLLKTEDACQRYFHRPLSVKQDEEVCSGQVPLKVEVLETNKFIKVRLKEGLNKGAVGWTDAVEESYRLKYFCLRQDFRLDAPGKEVSFLGFKIKKDEPLKNLLYFVLGKTPQDYQEFERTHRCADFTRIQQMIRDRTILTPQTSRCALLESKERMRQVATFFYHPSAPNGRYSFEERGWTDENCLSETEEIQQWKIYLPSQDECDIEWPNGFHYIKFG